MVSRISTVKPTHVQRFSGDLYDGSVSYWSSDPGGDIYLHGGDSFHFDPPVLYLDVPLSVGKAWSTTTATPSGAVTYTGRVVEVRSVTVPAGTFGKCTVVARFSDEIYYAVEFFADGVGLVERAWHDPFRDERLVSLPGPVTVVSSTWSGVRLLYQ